MPVVATRGAASIGGFGGRQGAKSILFDYLVVGGGGSAFTQGSGAGGYRTSYPGGTKISLVGANTITVGGSGSDSSIGTLITSNRGGGGSGSPGEPGGSGAGGGAAGGTGNLGGFTPPEGNPGGGAPYGPPNTSPPCCNDRYGGGGGASASGTPQGPDWSGNGGDGSLSAITGSNVGLAGGGGGSSYWGNVTQPGGFGGSTPLGRIGGNGARTPANPGNPWGQAGTVNTGSGSGYANGGASGVIVLRCPGPLGPAITVGPPTNTKSTSPAPDGAATVCRFTTSGTLTIS